MVILRTPEDRFAGLPDFPYEPRYVEVDGGLRVAVVEVDRHAVQSLRAAAQHRRDFDLLSECARARLHTDSPHLDLCRSARPNRER